ncbi:MAG: hypothetical protein LBV32_08140 [Tannerellaceae bacterium]|nr:hypothetical protein [Tannerellaceae bacterium]
MKAGLAYLFAFFSVSTAGAQTLFSFEEVARRLYNFYSYAPVEPISKRTGACLLPVQALERSRLGHKESLFAVFGGYCTSAV